MSETCRSCGEKFEPYAALVYGHRINSLVCIDCFGVENELNWFGMMYVLYGDQDPEGVRGKKWRTGDPWPKESEICENTDKEEKLT